MRAQPGLLFCQLHRGIGGASVLMNYAVWESLSAFRAAFDNPEFWEAAKNMPEGVVARSLLVERIAVSNICVAYEALETAIQIPRRRALRKAGDRPEERRGGKEGVSRCRS